MKKAIGILYSLNGLSMLIVWPMLILTNQAPEIKTNFSYMCFHLTSEFLTGILCLITGIGLLINREWANKNYFLASGFFIGAGYLAIGYYIFSDLSSSLAMLIMLCVINIIGLFLFIIVIAKGLLVDLSNYIKLSLFFNGITVYTLINIAGFLSERNSGYTYGYMSMIFILLIYTVWNINVNLKNGKAKYSVQQQI